jgi:hypothetical protein
MEATARPNEVRGSLPPNPLNAAAHANHDSSSGGPRGWPPTGDGGLGNAIERRPDCAPSSGLGLFVGESPRHPAATAGCDAAGADGDLSLVGCLVQGLPCAPLNEDHKVADLPHCLRQGKARQSAALPSLRPLRYQGLCRLHFQPIGSGLARTKPPAVGLASMPIRQRDVVSPGLRSFCAMHFQAERRLRRQA